MCYNNRMTQKTKVILFNYGGGLRGIIPARIMSRIEERTGLRMAEMVDVFTGPSTGAILNASLNVPHPNKPKQPKYRARHMVKFYEREGKRIFPADRLRDFRALIHDFNNRTMKIAQLRGLFRHGHYDPSHLQKCMGELFGETKLSDSLRSLVIPVYNIDGDHLNVVEERGEDDNAPVHTKNNFLDEGGHAIWLKNMKLGYRKRPTPNVSMYDAIMASTAAPTYFPCHRFEVKYNDERGNRCITGIDGSLFDNPCISYHGAVRQHLHEDTKVIMIALGTGYTARSIKKEDWNSYGGLGVVDPVNDLPLINILFHAPESALMESFSQEIGDDFYVFNKSMAPNEGIEGQPSLDIDDGSPENIRALRNFADSIVEENQVQFDRVCDLLIKNYKQRQQREHQAQSMAQRFFSALKGE